LEGQTIANDTEAGTDHLIRNVRLQMRANVLVSEAYQNAEDKTESKQEKHDTQSDRVTSKIKQAPHLQGVLAADIHDFAQPTSRDLTLLAQ
jgi:hypothetical protein